MASTEQEKHNTGSDHSHSSSAATAGSASVFRIDSDDDNDVNESLTLKDLRLEEVISLADSLHDIRKVMQKQHLAWSAYHLKMERVGAELNKTSKMEKDLCSKIDPYREEINYLWMLQLQSLKAGDGVWIPMVFNNENPTLLIRVAATEVVHQKCECVIGISAKDAALLGGGSYIRSHTCSHNIKEVGFIPSPLGDQAECKLITAFFDPHIILFRSHKT